MKSVGTAVPLALALSPTGALRLVDEPADSIIPAALAARVLPQFERGVGYGLLHLGAAEARTPLPPTLAFWRDFARRYVSALRAVPGLEAARSDFSVPPQDFQDALAGAPPMVGGEYLTAQVLAERWRDVEQALRAELAAFAGTVAEWLRSMNPAWHLVGRVHFHLAENKRTPERPFAFLATYTKTLGQSGKPQHVPLGRALEEYAGDRAALLSLLEPVQAAAERSPFVRELVESKQVFHPLAWQPAQAYALLQDLEACEAAGVVVTVPSWWGSRRTARPVVRVSVGDAAPAGLGLNALLDFKVETVLDGQTLTEDEMAALLSGSAGLALIRGRWVEADPARLRALLEHWRKLQRASDGGVSFLEGLRLLAGASGGAGELEAGQAELGGGWSELVAGPWLAGVLKQLKAPEASTAARETLGRALRTELRPYQEAGVQWLRLLTGLGLGGCLADDMGLGKTVQVLALLALRKQAGAGRPSLLVVPASLIANWMSEASRFTPGLSVKVAHPSVRGEAVTDAAAAATADVVLTSYGYLTKLAWAATVEWDLVVADEAQAIKNPDTQQARAVRAQLGRTRLALTGTPIENRLGDLWSLFEFVNPGLLGTQKAFGDFCKGLEQRTEDRFGPLRALVRPYVLRRMKSDPTVISDLPAKTEVRAFCGLTKQQAALYQETTKQLKQDLQLAPEGIQRRGVVLGSLLRLKQICNHPSHWLHDGGWEPAASGKFARLRELIEPIAARQERVLVFTQFKELTGPLADYLAELFGRPGLVLHGATPVARRRELVDSFQTADGPPFFVLSLKAGGTGLNLTAASHVIHFDRWWNPAVEDQATDRAYRIGQHENVLVHKFVCRGTLEQTIDEMLESKRKLSADVLAGSGEAALTELDDAELLRVVTLDLDAALQEA